MLTGYLKNHFHYSWFFFFHFSKIYEVMVLLLQYIIKFARKMHTLDLFSLVWKGLLEGRTIDWRSNVNVKSHAPWLLFFIVSLFAFWHLVLRADGHKLALYFKIVCSASSASVSQKTPYPKHAMENTHHP